MVRLFVRHSVADFAAWRAAYDAFDVERRSMGVIDDGVFQAVDDARDVTAWHDFATLESARAFLDSPRLPEVMKAAGVVGEPTIWLVQHA